MRALVVATKEREQYPPIRKGKYKTEIVIARAHQV